MRTAALHLPNEFGSFPPRFDNKSKGVEISIKDINGFLKFFDEVINMTLNKDFKQMITISKLEENV